MQQFDYTLDYSKLNMRRHPELYCIGRGEQGVLLVEPYKSELLPLWAFRDRAAALKSSRAIYQRYLRYRAQRDFVGMDMARKFLQMGFTRARRYANRSSGRKYAADSRLLPLKADAEKAKCAEIFRRELQRVREDPRYLEARANHRMRFSPEARDPKTRLRRVSRQAVPGLRNERTTAVRGAERRVRSSRARAT
jgi:hypothetical protein